jgi:predicted metal-binding membrane protein
LPAHSTVQLILSMMTANPPLPKLEALLRRDRALLLAGLTFVTFAAWAYLFHLARGMSPGGSMEMTMDMVMPRMLSWGPIELLLLLAMWAVMMVAMMVPSITPLILLFAAANREKDQGRVFGSAAILGSGYFVVWAGFSVLATLATWGL